MWGQPPRLSSRAKLEDLFTADNLSHDDWGSDNWIAKT